MTDYYDVTLKERSHAMLLQGPNFSALNARIEEPDMLKSLMRDEKIDVVVHLAAQAGVRYSIEDPNPMFRRTCWALTNCSKRPVRTRQNTC